VPADVTEGTYYAECGAFKFGYEGDSEPDAFINFGESVALSIDGRRLAVGAPLAPGTASGEWGYPSGRTTYDGAARGEVVFYDEVVEGFCTGLWGALAPVDGARKGDMPGGATWAGAATRATRTAGAACRTRTSTPRRPPRRASR